jgi:hypothetical protein
VIPIGHDVNPTALSRALHRSSIKKIGTRVKSGVTILLPASGGNPSTLCFVMPRFNQHRFLPPAIPKNTINVG